MKEEILKKINFIYKNISNNFFVDKIIEEINNQQWRINYQIRNYKLIKEETLDDEWLKIQTSIIHWKFYNQPYLFDLGIEEQKIIIDLIDINNDIYTNKRFWC